MMFILKIVSLLSLLIYVGYLVRSCIGFTKTETFIINDSHINITKTCVIICAKNEEYTIEKCLSSVFSQNFDKELLELILVNDGSTDNTKSVAEKLFRKIKSLFNLLTMPKVLARRKVLPQPLKLAKAN
ncbi:MAG: glycosyltransferase family 2 protein [Sphingobacteriaceae bacterium]|nr:glycosyltransferase family 2 protein [Sphingobacteriaceae bacterium]